MMANKLSITILSVISCLVLFFTVIFTAATCEGGTIVPQADPDDLNYFYGTAGCMYLMDKNGITVDSDLKKKVKADAQSWLQVYHYKTLGSSQLAKLICVDRYFSLGYTDTMIDELNRRYNSERKLFMEEVNMDYGDNPSEDDRIAYDMRTTDSVCSILEDMNIKNTAHDLPQVLADAFNAHVNKYNINQTMGNTWTISNSIENTFYYFLNKGTIERINYAPVWNELSRHYTKDLFESNKESSSFQQFSAENLPAVYTDSQVVHELGASFQLTYTSQNYYQLLNTEEAFGVSNEKTFTYYLYSYLNQDPDLGLAANYYFATHINEWLSKNYRSVKGVDHSQAMD